MTRWELLQQPFIIEIFTIGSFFLAASFVLMCLDYLLKDWVNKGKHEDSKRR